MGFRERIASFLDRKEINFCDSEDDLSLSMAIVGGPFFFLVISYSLALVIFILETRKLDSLISPKEVDFSDDSIDPKVEAAEAAIKKAVEVSAQKEENRKRLELALAEALDSIHGH